MHYITPELTEWRKIGIGLTAFGVFFIFLGIVLFFDRGFIAMGNLLFLSGVMLVIGVKKTLSFFFQKRKWKGTVCFLIGFVLILYGWAFIGMLIEGFGFINLFGDFFPIVISFARRLPIIGHVLDLPILRHVVEKYIEGSRLPV